MNTPPATITQTGSILVVDDDELIRTILGEMLTQAGFNTRVACDGAEALELFARNPVDVILTDVDMPNLNGFDLCTMVRVMPGGQRVQVMFMTGLDDVEQVKHAYEIGANEFAIKTDLHPFLVLERVRFLLRSQRLQDDLRLSEQRLIYAQRLAHLGHWERSIDGKTLAVSPVVYQMLGLNDPAQLSWDSLCAQTHPDDVPLMQLAMQRSISLRSGFRLEHRLTTARGKLLVLRHHGEVVVNDAGQLVIRSTVQDVTETRAQEDRIRFLAFNDPLTSLPNRESALRSLRQAIAATHRESEHVAVFALSIDDFPRINSSLGQATADAVLKHVGDRLRAQIRFSDHVAQDVLDQDENCLVARGEGDRFICIVSKMNMNEAAMSIAKRLQRAVANPLDISNTHLQLTASVGISLYPQDGVSAEQLLDHANAALMYSKNQKASCRFFANEISSQARERLTLEAELRQALERKEFVMYYQPRMTLMDHKIRGAEALVRWQHPTRGLVMPGEFIPLLEEMDLITELGNQVIEMVTLQSVIWRERLGQQFRISFNISPLQFEHGNLLESIDAAVLAAQAHAENLEIEITESALMVHPESVIQTLHKLRRRGFRLALDDFGTGFSSLSYLRKLPMDVLKIDRSFISDIGVTHGGSSLVSAILFMAHALDMECVAEGVEHETQLNFLSVNHCEEAQGFWLSKALAPAQFESWMSDRMEDTIAHKIA